MKKNPGREVAVYNPTNYPLIGRGKQGAVFKLSKTHCVKIFATRRDFERESAAYLNAKGSPIIPKLYKIGPNYIIMEYIDGISLQEYLRKKRMLPEMLTKQILFMFHEMKRLKFKRMNIRLKHIILTKKYVPKVVDHVNTFLLKDKKPIFLFDELDRLGLLRTFLKQVKKLDRDTYREWKKSMSEYFE
ncbi:MAG: kinase [Clostridiaceae bacterium]|nr:kinase [Clostridiaceae bacterium]